MVDFFRYPMVKGHGYCDIDTIYYHEHVIVERLEKFVDYLLSLKPLIILPSIIVCHKTNVLIDGHHRCHALLRLGIRRLPVTYIDYESDHIVPHVDASISKQDILGAGLTQELLPPKSSYHHLIDLKGQYRPIALLSHLSDMK